MKRTRRKQTPVVNIFSREPIPQFNGEVQAALVERLEEMTQRAKAGWLRGVCMAYEYSDNSYSWEGVGMYDRARMTGSLRAICWELERALADGDKADGG